MQMSNSPSSPQRLRCLAALGSSNVRRLAIFDPHLDQPRQSSMCPGSNVEGDVSLCAVLGRSGLNERAWLEAMTMRLGLSRRE